MTRWTLTRWQRQRLRRQLKETPDARVFQRTLGILEYDAGQSIAQIATRLRVSRQSVYNWIASYRHSPRPAALLDEDRPGRPSLWTENLRALVQSLFGQAPEACGYFAANWTVPLLQEELAHRTGQRLSDDTIRRELDRLGYTWKRSRYVLEPDPAREKKTAAAPASARNQDPVAAQRLPG